MTDKKTLEQLKAEWDAAWVAYDEVLPKWHPAYRVDYDVAIIDAAWEAHDKARRAYLKAKAKEESND